MKLFFEFLLFIDIAADVLPFQKSHCDDTGTLFDHKKESFEQIPTKIPECILSGSVSIVFSHPEALFTTYGRNLLKSEIYRNNTAAYVIDEAHCVTLW